MPCKQGDLALLQHPACSELLESKIPARLAYIWTDGTPRVIPIWFTGMASEFVMGTPPKAPKLKLSPRIPKLRSPSTTTLFLIRCCWSAARHAWNVNGIVPEYAIAAERYFGPDKDKPGSRTSEK